MTSEIRANTLKNRVGLGTVSFTNTGPVVSGIVTANGLELNSVDAGSSAGPEFKLFRNSASPADADYLGQLKFAGESDTGVERNYAKITGKILDASNGTEDGILEFAHIKAGSQTITGRWRSDSLQLLNGTSLTVAGTSEFTGDATFSSDLIIPDYIKHLGDTNTMIGFPSNDSFSVTTNNVTRMTFTGNFIDIPDAGTFRLGNSNDLQIYHGSGGASNIIHSNTSQPLIISATGAGSIRFDTNSNERFRITDAASSFTNKLIIDDGSNGHLFLNNTSSENTIHSGTTGFAAYKNLVINAAQHTFKVSNAEKLSIEGGGHVTIAETFAVNRPRIVLSAPDQGSSVYSHLFGANLRVNSSGTFTTPTSNISGGGWEYLSANSLNAHGNIRYLSAPDTNATSSTPLERLRIDSSGFVGVGTATIGRGPLELSRSDTGDVQIHMTNAKTGGGTGKGFTIFGCNASAGDAGFVNRYAGGAIEFYTNQSGTVSEKVRISSNGLVNIGAGSGVSGLSPLLHLHKNASNSTAYLHITNNTTGMTNNDGFLLGINGVGDCLVFNKDSTPIRFATQGIERLRIDSSGKVGINATPSQMFEVHTDFGLDDNTYQVRTSYRSGNNASGYTASGLHITSSADNNNGEKHTAFLGFSSRDPALNGSHGSNAFIAMSTPDSPGTYGTGQLDFYIRGGAPYAFPNDPQAASSYWMESLFRIESNGRVKVPGELRVDRIIPAGGLPSSTFGGVVQIRWSANVDNANYSSTSDVTMQTVNFTPLRSDSRVLIHVVYPSIRSYTTGNTRNRLNQHIKRDGTEIYNLGEMPQWRGANFAGSGVEINHNVAFTHIDYPNTTNQVTYTATWQSVDGHVWNTASAQMVMIVAEISG